jgi:diguanylate cyclase (GGDEF)-like protein
MVGRNPDRTVPLQVVVSIPRNVVLAKANGALLQTVGGIIIATLLLLLAAWYGAGAIVVRRIGTMLNVAQRVRSGDLTARTGFASGSDELAALGHALDDMAQSLENRDAELQRALAALSGLYNRRYLWDFLKRELLRSQRRSLPVALIMLDIDHFKRFNDTWGHRAGDAVIKRVAEVILRSIRGSDIACRYGGEEFIAILPEATRQAALERAETMRRELEALELEFDGKPLGKVTGSFGVAVFPQHGAAAEALVRAADEALYEAKGAGRNRVVLHGQGGKPPADADLNPAVERSLSP